MMMQLLLLPVFLIFCQLQGSLAQATAPAEGLILHLPFDGNTNDVAGGGHHGVKTGATPATDRNGNTASAYYFDGNDSIIVAADHSLLNVNTEGWTLSFWAKPDQAQDRYSVPMVSYGYGRHGGYAVSYWYDYGMFRTDFYDYSWTGISVSKDEFDEHSWYLLTLIYDGQTLKKYVNGVLVNEGAITYYPTLEDYDYSLAFGTDSASASYFYKGFIDDVRIYNRVLTDLEIAQMSEMSGVVRAVEFDAYSLADFEWGRLEPVKFSNFWAVWGNDQESYTEVVENPIKAGLNTSDYVGVSHSFPSLPLPDTSDCEKSEYVLTTATGEGLLTDQHHIMRWKVLFTNDNILNIDIVWNWMSFNQIHSGAAKYPNGPGTTATDDTIAYGGGIFNDLKKADEEDPSIYSFRYRAIPDETLVPFQINIGQWMSFTYEILWTTSDNGFWRVYKDGELLASADNVKTLPDSYDPTEDDFLHFKTGLYNKWSDPENKINVLDMYFDDLELFIGDEISVEDVCPECMKQPSESSKTMPWLYFLLLDDE
ncbi:LamG-like jellyroll fold domain-containing protein [Desulforhopalus sp. 52FAK]